MRFLWPVFIRRAGFIVRMTNGLDQSKTLAQLQEDNIAEFISLLGKGPYLGGRNMISLADLSAYAVIAFPYRFGLQGDADWMENSAVLEWISAVDEHLPDNPFLVDDSLLRNLET